MVVFCSIDVDLVKFHWEGLEFGGHAAGVGVNYME